MSPETINAVKDLLTPVAEKIGRGADHGWDVLVKGQFAEGIANLAIAAVLSLLIYITAKKIIALGKTDSGADYIPVYIFGGLFIIIGGIIALCCFYSGVIGTVAPEYAAIKFLLESSRSVSR